MQEMNQSNQPNILGGYIPSELSHDIERKSWHYTLGGKDVTISAPSLSPEQLQALAAQLKVRQQQYLSTLSVDYIVEVIAAAIERMLDRQDELRKQAEQLLPIITGYAPEMVRLGLTTYLKNFRRPQLLRFLQEDFQNYSILDDFRPAVKGGFCKAYGPVLSVHIWAGNVPGLPLWSLVSALLVKSAIIGKLPTAEPLFTGLFVQALADIDRKLADCIAIVWWQGGDELREDVLFSQAELVLAYGSNTTLASIRRRVPIETRLIEYGSKLSLALIGREALEVGKVWKTAHAAAMDIIAYDQQGCYSPHFLYVEGGGAVSAKQFTYYVAHELEALEFKYPRRELSIEELTRWAGHKRELQLLDWEHEATPHVIGQETHNWTVVYESKGSLKPSPLDRFITIAAIPQLEGVTEQLAAYRPYLQTAGVAATPKRLFSLAELLGAAGVTRISALGKMSAPEAGWHHDGRFNLADLVRMVDIELGAELAAEQYTAYCD